MQQNKTRAQNTECRTEPTVHNKTVVLLTVIKKTNIFTVIKKSLINLIEQLKNKI